MAEEVSLLERKADPNKYRVPLEQLRWNCDTSQFRFECTAELPPLQEFIGQERALRAIEFGLAMDKPRYNLFVTGLTGTGKTSAIKSYIQKIVAERGERAKGYYPNDWCYIYNFADPDRPRIISLPQGRGKVFRAQGQELLKKLKAEIPRAFASEDYQAQRKQIVEEGQSRQQKLFQEAEREALKEGFLLQASPMGILLIPHVDGRPLTPQEYLSLDEEQRNAIESRQRELTKRVEETLQKGRALEKETLERVKDLDQKIGEFAITHLFDELAAECEAYPGAAQYLRELKSYTLTNLEAFREQEEPTPKPSGPIDPRLLRETDPFLPFQANVFVDNSATSGPPIVVEPNPTYGTMFGKIERRAFMGTYFSDHTMLKAGAAALANGGYLILNARDVLMNPGVWEGLKRVIKNQEVRLEDPFEQYGFVVPQGLRPEPMPVDEKVVMIGDPTLYALLSRYDEDFWELFKVKADFDFQIPRNVENMEAYASFICAVCERDSLRPFDRTAVAKVVEHGARMVADQEKLSSRFGQLRDVVIEADYWATKNGRPMVTGEDVHQAVEEKIYRSNLVEERIRELIKDGIIMVDTEGEVVGQVNGLAVYELGDLSFGKPSRITAKIFMGRGGVINIEREAQLSGRIHDKGVLILTGYLGFKYAQDKPLSLSASLCFEQSYEGVEGDSASSTELYAILSSLAGLPIKQSIAITGSVNQKGEIQPIGGVNQKIEGFFEVCKAKGLTGEQGVIIPHQNARNLMLREEVVEAAREGRFHIYAVKTIDEGMEVLTGLRAGEKGPEGSYPEGTVNYLVDKRLRELAEGLKRFGVEGKGDTD